MVANAIGAGARGVAIGRNVFQHRDPTLITRRICSIVHQGMTAEEALEVERQPRQKRVDSKVTSDIRRCSSPP
jgi:hypothetical protein